VLIVNLMVDTDDSTNDRKQRGRTTSIEHQVRPGLFHPRTHTHVCVCVCVRERV
jgi:hypothetical protein